MAEINKKGSIYQVFDARTQSEIKTKDVECAVKIVPTDHPQSQRLARKILEAIKDL